MNTNELKEKIINNKLYLLTLKDADVIYIDHKKMVYMFTSLVELRKEIHKFNHLSYKEYSIDDYDAFIFELFKKGIRFIELKLYDEKSVIYNITPVFPNKFDFINPDAEYMLFRLKYKKNLSTLKEFYNVRFIVPVKIIHKKEHKTPRISYVSAKANGKEYLPIFSLKEDFDKWNINKEYKPLLLSILKIKTLCEKDGVVINVSTRPIIIKRDDLRQISKPKKTK